MSTLKVLELKENFQKHYRVAPLAVLEFNFDNSGEHDDEKRKKSMAFVKRLNALSPALHELAEVQFNLYGAFTDFAVVYKLGSNYHAYNALGKLYGSLEKRMKEFKTVLKKHSNQPEVAELYKPAVEMLDMSAFDMMRLDFEVAKPMFEERMREDQSRFPEFTHWDTTEVDFETVKENFKKAK